MKFAHLVAFFVVLAVVVTAAVYALFTYQLRFPLSLWAALVIGLCVTALLQWWTKNLIGAVMTDQSALLGATIDQMWTAAARKDGLALRGVIDSLASAGFPRAAIVIRDTLHAQNVGGWADILFGDVDYRPDNDEGDEITVRVTPVFQLTVVDRAGAARTFGGVLTDVGLLRIEVPATVDRDVIARLDTCTRVFVTGRLDRSGPRPTLVLSMIEPSDQSD